MTKSLRERAVIPDRYGWKAFYLAELMRLDLRVPDGFALAVDEEFSSDDLGLLGPDGGEVALAVRSSSCDEDTTSQSMAGSFRTSLNVVGVQEVTAAVADVRASARGHQMGVIIQRLVDADLSGVALSIDPGTFYYSHVTLSWTKGLGASLVSGDSVGHDLVVNRETGLPIEGDWPYEADLLAELLGVLAKLDCSLGGPVDVEWCVEARTRHLYILQVRPVVLPIAQTVDLDDADSFTALPPVVASHPKVALRRLAAQLGIPMTPARASIGNRRDPRQPVPIERGLRAAGSSVVLLHPFTVENRIVREFAKVDRTDIEFITRECRRYSIRQYPSFENIADTENRVLATGLDVSAVAVVLEQEIWNAHATGIIRRLDDGYLIEVALGHFVPKGYVQTSAYLVNAAGAIVSSHETRQDSALHFYNGHVVREDEPEGVAWLDESATQRIVIALSPLLSEVPHLALEFGLTDFSEVGSGDGLVYLIDAAESDEESSSLTIQQNSMNVVSRGRAQGLVADLRGHGTEDLDAHLYQRISIAGPDKPAIFIAERASVDLLPLVYGCPPGCGFVFEQASLLSHLSVVLRERGIPGAIVSPETIAGLQEGDWVVLDTDVSPVLKPAATSLRPVE